MPYYTRKLLNKEVISFQLSCSAKIYFCFFYETFFLMISNYTGVISHSIPNRWEFQEHIPDTHGGRGGLRLQKPTFSTDLQLGKTGEKLPETVAVYIKKSLSKSKFIKWLSFTAQLVQGCTTILGQELLSDRSQDISPNVNRTRGKNVFNYILSNLI